MAGTHRPALTVGGGAGGAAIGRDVADRQRFATVLNGGFKDAHGRRVGLMWAARQGLMAGTSRPTPPAGRPCAGAVPVVPIGGRGIAAHSDRL
jgi:hypothetical protein